MESLFISNEEFFDGEVFAATDEEFLYIRSPRRSRNSSRWLHRSGVAATSRRVLISVTVGVMAALSVGFSAPANASITPSWTIQAAVVPESAPDPGDFRAARESLGLTQRKAAAVLHTSEPALEQFEQGRVNPGRAFSIRYTALVDLDRLLSKALGEDVELRRAYLYGRGAFFGGTPPLEWAATAGRPDAITEILAIYRRTLS